MTPNALSVALAERRAAGKRVLDLTASNPTECGFTYDSEAILAALSNPSSLIYDPQPRGLLTAREAVCEYYAARGDRVSPDDVVLTTSTSEAYSFVFRLLCNAGDEVLVPQPSYPLFDFLAELSDVRLVRYPLLYDHGWQIDFHSLEQAITPRTRAIIVVHPNNPTGNFSKAHEIAQLSEICAARGLAIIADEVFLDYSFGQDGGETHTSLPELAPQSFASNAGALTFTLSGLSKISGLPQMKASWLVTSGPEKLREVSLSRLEVIADTFLSMNAPVQHAMPALLRLRHAFQTQLTSRALHNLGELDRQLVGGRGDWARLRLEGGWYAVLRLGAQCDAGDLAMRLLEDAGVYLHPGLFYDFAGERYLVVSMITPSRDFSNGVRTLIAKRDSGEGKRSDVCGESPVANTEAIDEL